MDKFEIRCDKDTSGVCVLRLSGAVTLNSLFDLQDTLRKETSGALIIELADVPYMDSAGLGALLGAFASCQRHQRKFALASVSDRVLALLRVTKVDGLVPQYATVDAAVADWGVKAEGA